jgi:hypothetical protein
MTMQRLRARDDDGNLMLLAGIIVTIAFILTALTLAQVASLEREAASERPTTISTEWRFLHDHLAENLMTAVSAQETNISFSEGTFPAVAATFRSAEAEKGFDVSMRLAGAGAAVNKTEYGLLNVANTNYDAYAYGGAVKFTQLKDAVDNGLLWQAPCPDDTALATGCITGVLVAVRVTDGLSSMEEVVLVAVNQG